VEFATTYVAEQGFNQVLHMSNTVNTAIVDMNKTEGMPYDSKLTNLQPGLKNCR